jgi:hypothetical protein
MESRTAGTTTIRFDVRQDVEDDYAKKLVASFTAVVPNFTDESGNAWCEPEVLDARAEAEIRALGLRGEFEVSYCDLDDGEFSSEWIEVK